MKLSKLILKGVLKDESSYLANYLGEKLPYSWFIRNSKRKNGLAHVELPARYRRELRKFWKEQLGIRVNMHGYEYFHDATATEDVTYIPEDVFFKYIVRRLNKFSFSRAYSDKNFYDRLFPGVRTPETVVRNINGCFYDTEYRYLSEEKAVRKVLDALQYTQVIVKPSLDSGGGKNIMLLDGKDIRSLKPCADGRIKGIFDHYSKDYIVQLFLNQHELFNAIYPHSLNTMRIISFEQKGMIYVLASVLKMGNNSGFLDKVSMGGLSIGINNDGRLKEYAFSKERRKVFAHPQTKFEFKDTVIPNFDEALALVRQLHQQISAYFRFVSWDIALGSDGKPILIEANLRYQGVMIPQLNCGPLFGSQTQEILAEISR